MTRSEAYAAGFNEGRRWAEEDIVNRQPRSSEEDRLRTLAVDSHALSLTEAGDRDAAKAFGNVRGYRDTWARWDAGTLTWEMLEHAPVNR